MTTRMTQAELTELQTRLRERLAKASEMRERLNAKWTRFMEVLERLNAAHAAVLTAKTPEEALPLVNAGADAEIVWGSVVEATAQLFLRMALATMGVSYAEAFGNVGTAADLGRPPGGPGGDPNTSLN